MTRADRHAQVRALKATGLTFKQIAARLGVVVSIVTEAYYDPSGETTRRRRHRRHGVCVDCGASTYNGGSVVVPERCRSCERVWRGTLDGQRASSRRTRGRMPRWTEEQMVDAIRSLAVDGFLRATDYEARRGESRPSYLAIHHRLGWGAACALAGVATVTKSVRRSDRMPVEGCVLSLRDCIDEFGRTPTYVEYELWARRNGAVSGRTVRNRFGGLWMEALEAAVAVELDGEGGSGRAMRRTV